VSRNRLREDVEHLREYMQSASSFRGPEVGNVWSLGTAYAGGVLARNWRDKMDQQRSEKERAEKRKKSDFRADLRRLALWRQQKRER